LEAAIQYFIPWGTRSTVRLAADAGVLNSGDFLFTNEMFRLGGYARLRGFDEESILAQYYSIFSAEYRLIIGGASYISMFGDYAWIKNEDVDLPFEDRPFGFGFGLNLETKAGIFGMRVAVGAQRGNAINFDNARLHFGYVNRF
jgi:hemolysin activation/secretion protein